MSTMPKVRRHLDEAARAHRKTHQDALREAAVARAEQDASQVPAAYSGGLQGDTGGFWEDGDD